MARPGGRCATRLVLLCLGSLALSARELRLAVAEYPASIHPVYAVSETGQAVINKLYHSLFAHDGSGRLTPELVEGWQRTGDDTVVHLTLKPGFFFPGGRMLDAGDVAATFALLRDPRFAFPYRSDLDFIAAIEPISARTVRLRLRHPHAAWRTYLTFKILAAEEIRQATPLTFARSLPGGTGPYRVVRQDAARELVLERNPGYRGALPATRLVYEVQLDPRTMPQKLVAGEVDAGEIQPEDAELFPRRPDWSRRFRLIPYEKFGFTYLAFNTRRPAIDREFRRTVYRRLVAGTFLSRFLRGRGRPVYSPVLALGEEKPLAIATPRPLPPGSRRVRLLTNSESRLRRHFVLFAAEELKKDGIVAEPVFLEYHSFMKAVRGGDFDLAVSAFLLDLDYNVRDILASDGVCNYAGWADPALDRLLQEGLAEMDEEKRRQIYRRVHRCWAEELPLLPLFSLYYHMGVAPSLHPARDPVRIIGSCGDFFYRIGDWALTPP